MMSRRNPYVIRSNRGCNPPPRMLSRKEIEDAVQIAQLNGWIERPLPPAPPPSPSILSVNIFGLGPAYISTSADRSVRWILDVKIPFTSEFWEPTTQSNLNASLSAEQVIALLCQYDAFPGYWFLKLYFSTVSSSYNCLPSLHGPDGTSYSCSRSFQTRSAYPFTATKFSYYNTNKQVGCISLVGQVVLSDKSDYPILASSFSGYSGPGGLSSWGSVAFPRESLNWGSQQLVSSDPFGKQDFVAPIEADVNL
ncbi:Cap [Circular ssDNA virus sp.]|nr:Cap [Circular ssDNA virus sp.]